MKKTKYTGIIERLPKGVSRNNFDDANTNMDKTPIWDKINGEFVTEEYFRKLEKLRLLNQAWYDKSKQQEVKLRAENYPNSLDIVPSAGKVIEDERDLRNIIEEQPDE